jgi:hypothetical protein
MYDLIVKVNYRSIAYYFISTKNNILNNKILVNGSILSFITSIN